MPVFSTNSGYGYVYRRNIKKRRFPPIFTFLAFVIIFCGVVGGAFYLAINVQTILGLNNNVFFKHTNIYAIEVASCADYATANVLSETLKKQGGAGYILSKDNQHHVLISAYSSRTDALKVVENLEESGVEASVYQLQLPELIINMSLTGDEQKIIKDAVNAFYNSYEKLYQLSVSLDSKSLSKAEILEQLSEHKQSVQVCMDEFSRNFVMSSNVEFVYLKIYLTNLITNLTELGNKQENFSGEIKHTYFKCLGLYINFWQEF